MDSDTFIRTGTVSGPEAWGTIPEGFIFLLKRKDPERKRPLPHLSISG